MLKVKKLKVKKIKHYEHYLHYKHYELYKHSNIMNFTKSKSKFLMRKDNKH